MEFLKHLEKERKEYLNRHSTDSACSSSILFNNDIKLSIQGSGHHYCFPLETLIYKKYTHLEFALLLDGHQIVRDCFIEVNSLLDTDDYNVFYEGEVYAYVPVEKVEKLYQMLKKKYGLRKRNKNKRSGGIENE